MENPFRLAASLPTDGLKSLKKLISEISEF
jgi:hypothetical protein